jgi:hypothetical protein
MVMLTLLGNSRHCCDGLSRRELMRVGALACFGGLFLPSLAPAAKGTARRAPGKARSVILLDLFGGPSHLDTFDPKPDAPAEVRGEFAAIATSLPGVLVSEHLPCTARWLRRTSLIRTVSHGYNSHNPYAVMTGFTGGNDRDDYYAKPTNHPSMGSVLKYLEIGRPRGLPGYVCLPAFPGYSQGLRRAGPYGGYLGSQYDPFCSACDPKFAGTLDENRDFYSHTIVPMGDPQLPALGPELTVNALDRRRSLLQQVDARTRSLDSSAATNLMSHRQREAFELLLSPAARRAFDLGKEPPPLRDHYGRGLFGSCVLLARRLVEAGVTFVTIHTEAKPNGHWDTHENNFNMLQHVLLPFLDRAVAALLEDLDGRGLLETTLVLVTGDMGRTPRVNKKAGRDHWPQCGFCLLAGGGVKEGLVYGTSDRQGAYPKDRPVSPGDLVATVYQLTGADPERTIPDQSGQPIPIAHGGKPIWDILA